MTELPKRMLGELQRRNYSPTTIRYYLRVVETFARYFGKRPDRLTQEDIREYQVYLLQDRKLQAGTVGLHIAALRFFFVKTLRRPYLQLDLPSPKRPKRLPTVLSQDEVARLIKSANNLLDYAMLMTLYATGVRRAELSRLKVEDIDSQRMIVHIRQGKGNRDRDVPLTTTKLLKTLREYWQWMKPKTYLFPGMVNNWRADKPLTPKCVWSAVQDAAKRAGITKRVSPHTLRHSWPITY
jgi:integrase/recombinase XerD